MVEIMEKKRKIVPDMKEIYYSYGRLPYELLYNILLKLPTLSLLTCKCVSKSWLSLVQDLRFIATFEAKFQPKKPLEWEIKDGPKLEVYSVDENGAATTMGRYRPSALISDTRYSNGLVCVYNKKEFRLDVLDLTTEVLIQLPQQQHFLFDSGEFGFEFGVDLCARKHKVLSWMEYKDSNFRPSNFQVLIFEENNTSSWKLLQNTPQNLPYLGQSETTANGSIFWFCFNLIVSFNLSTEKFRIIERPDMMNTLNFRLRMFGFEGGLCLIEQPVPMSKDTNKEKLKAHFDIRAMWMLKDIETSGWVKMKDITLPFELKPKDLCHCSFFSARSNELLIGSTGCGRVLFVYSFLTQQFSRINVTEFSELNTAGVKESCREV
ncbi:hypothetical protein ACHQM5_015057 [Ranunculus cassubicifolius]